MNVDLYRNTKTEATVTPALRSAAATVTGTAVNVADCRSALVLIVAGTITDGTHTTTVDHSADGVTWSDASAFLSAAPPALVAANANTVTELGYRGTFGYLRVKVATAGATTGGIIAGYVTRAYPYRAPLR